jgi:hypothetical protein
MSKIIVSNSPHRRLSTHFLLERRNSSRSLRNCFRASPDPGAECCASEREQHHQRFSRGPQYLIPIRVLVLLSPKFPWDTLNRITSIRPKAYSTRFKLDDTSRTGRNKRLVRTTATLPLFASVRKYPGIARLKRP